MDSPVLPSRGRTLRGALAPNRAAPILWRPAIASMVAAALAAWLAWVSGYQPATPAQWLYGNFPLGQELGFEYQMLVVWKVLPAALVALFVVLAGAFAPRARSLPTALLAAVVILATIFLAWGSIRSPWAVGPVMAVVIGLGPLARRHGGAVAGIVPLIAVIFFFFAVMGLAHELDPTGVLVQAGLGAGAGMAVLVAVWIVRALTGFALLQHPEPKPRATAPPPFLSGGVAMREALLAGALVGSAAGLYAATHNHNIYWILVTIWAVMQATPDATFDKGIKRAVGVMLGCLLIGALAQVATPDVVVIVGFAMMFLGIAWWMRNYTVYIAAISMMTVALHGDLHHLSFERWAFLRLADTLVGLAIGFAAYWLVVTLPEIRKARREGAGQAPA